MDRLIHIFNKWKLWTHARWVTLRTVLHTRQKEKVKSLQHYWHIFVTHHSSSSFDFIIFILQFILLELLRDCTVLQLFIAFMCQCTAGIISFRDGIIFKALLDHKWISIFFWLKINYFHMWISMKVSCEFLLQNKWRQSSELNHF